MCDSGISLEFRISRKFCELARQRQVILGTRVALSVLLLLAGWKVFHQLAALQISRIYPTVEGFQEALRWDPEGPDYYYRLGVIHRDNPEYQDLHLARYYLEKASQLNPYYWRYWLELARSYEISEMSVQAEQAYLKAVEINPRAPVYRWRFANFYIREGDLEKALPQFKTAIELDPVGYLQSTLAFLWKAGVKIEDILSIYPEDQRAGLMLMRFLVQQEGVEEGLVDSQWEKLLSENSNSVPIDEGEFYIQYLLDGGRFHKAREAWIRLVRGNGLEDKTYLKKENFVWNGAFEIPITGRALDWKAKPSVAYEMIPPMVSHKSPGFERDKGLRFVFKGTENINFNGFQQLVIVEPEVEYEFSFKARSEDISTEQGLYFEVVAESVILQTEQILGTTPLTEYSSRFKVPSDQSLVAVRLRRRPSRRIDNKLRGTLWLETVKLEKVSG